MSDPVIGHARGVAAPNAHGLARRVATIFGYYVCSACRVSVGNIDRYCRGCGARFTGTDFTGTDR